MNLKVKKIKSVLAVIVMIILLIVLFVSGVILVNSYIKPNEVPSFFGWKPFIVLSGSMETQIKTGDLVVVKEVDSKQIKENDIIAFKTKENTVVTHRIVEIVKTENNEARYITKGDNNNTKDSDYVLESQIEGLYQFKIAKLGNVAMFIQTPLGIIISISIPLLLLAILQIIDSKNERKITKEKEAKQKEMEEELNRLRQQKEKAKI